MSEYQEEITEDVSPHQEAAMREAFGLDEPEPESEDIPEEAPEPEEKPEPTPDPEESSAKQHGWTTKAEWVAQGKNPDDWVNAKHFNEKGRLINQARKLESLEKTFDARINNVKVLYDAQLRTLKAENSQLLQAKKEAVTYGDYDAVQKIDQQLMENAVSQVSINQAAEQVYSQPTVPQHEAEKEAAWERENQWINTQDPAAPEFGKAVFTRNLYQQLLQQYPNSTADERIAYVNREVSQKFPAAPKTNPNRDKAPVTDAKSARSTSSTLTMADLTPSERKDFDAFGVLMYGNGDTSKEGIAKAQKLFLQAVKDSRRG